MRKFIKVVEIIVIVLAVLCGAALIIGYAFFKDYTIEILTSIKDFINQPLPIVGVSILGLGLLLYEVVIRFNFGRRAIAKIIEEKDKELNLLKEKQEDIEEIKNYVCKILDIQNADIEETKAYLIELCNYSKNVKAKELAHKISGGVNNGEKQDGDTIKE